ncbi:MAG: IPT/TIG domain-containing protein [Anaerolineae bacterium]|nr:IPT/TIG domain-containing protein [Anaerolineae bacterium]
MQVYKPSQHKLGLTIFIIASITLLLILSVVTFVNADSNTQQSTTQAPFSTFTFPLTSGQSVDPSVYTGANKNINFSLAVTGTSATSEANLTIYNDSGLEIWQGKATNGEVLWGNVTLTYGLDGNNVFEIENTGSDSLSFTLNLYDIPKIQTPTPTYSWIGSSAPGDPEVDGGLNSTIAVNFPVSGLYTFDFDVNNGGQYEFLLGIGEIQRKVTGADTVSFYVAAGVHPLGIIQDENGAGLINWQVDIAYSGVASDSLPFTKSNTAINIERFPINLSAAAQVNMVITATGDENDQLFVNIFGADQKQKNGSSPNIAVYAGETVWTTFDLPAGTSSFELTTSGEAMSYSIEMAVLPSTDYAYGGTANPNGENSEIRLTFATAGLYDFDFGAGNGRYQFILNQNDKTYIQKTVENNNIVTYFVPAGTHNLIIDQDSTEGAAWDVAVSLNSASNNTLPYSKMGGEIGGSANDFNQEWLPISLSAPADVNLSINANGNTSDSFAVEIYQNGSSSPDASMSQVLGSEDQWTNFHLSAGINLIKIIANEENTAALSYELAISAIPTDGSMNWNGNVRQDGLNPVVEVNFPTTGLYHFNIDSTVGFANLVLDDHYMQPLTNAPEAVASLGSSYDIQVEAGIHEIYVEQDSSYSNTTWTASVAPTETEENFFAFNGTLNGGESITPTYPGGLDFNLSLTTVGDDVSLSIIDGDGSIIWSGTALDGETVWGTGTLSGTNQLVLTNTGSSSTDVSLELYHIPTAGYSWDGYADYKNDLNSQIRVNFPTAGLYTFTANADPGRYQFLVGSDFIQKTVESTPATPDLAQESSGVTYFVPAGIHFVQINQDSDGGNTDWDLTISNVGASHDSLPYAKDGGLLGGLGNDFDTEWLPINLAAATSVNIATTIAGDPGDSATLTVFNSSNSELGNVSVTVGETTWTTLDLPAGTSRLEVTSDENSDPVMYEVVVSGIPSAAAYTWTGEGIDTGENSHIRVNFASSGVYSFAFDVAPGNGRYQFLLNENFIQKTVEQGGGTVDYYVPAGTHDLYINQDSTAGADWSVAISGPIAAHDTLPYNKMGGAIGSLGNDFSEEWLPINLNTATSVNLSTTILGTGSDSADIIVWNANSQELRSFTVYTDETTWTTLDLPAGTSRIQIQANENSNPVDYELVVAEIPAGTAYNWAGNTTASGDNSEIRVNFPTAGLYTFASEADNGRFQYLLDIAEKTHIQKTEESVHSVVYFVPAGIHNLVIDQDSVSGADWSLAISLYANSNDSLPYTKAGGNLGGAANDFTAEWLPIALDAPANVNLSIDANGNTSDSFTIAVYQSGSSSPDYTLSQVLGSEEQWTNFQLSAGINYLKIMADGNNSAELAYDLEISAMPTSSMAWSGTVLDDGLNAAVIVNFPTTGFYRFTIDSALGFADLVLDDYMLAQTAPTASPPDLGTSYDLQVEAGLHEIYVIQDTAYPKTTWSASVAPIAADEQFFEFTGTLDGGESVTPSYPVPVGSREFNFVLEVSGNDVELEITNSSGTVWYGKAFDGETLWGTGTLSETNDLMISNAAGNPATVSLKLYDIPTAGYSWDGDADGSGLNSEIRVNFPTDGLYTFTASADPGRYQFLVDSEFVQKTVEDNSSVTYFVPAGMHYLNIIQDGDSAETVWDMAISGVGASHDVLPYAKAGGMIGGSGNDFDTEWLPINLSAATAVNIATTISGTDGDSVDVAMVNANDTVLKSITVYVGETTWTTVDLPAGTSRLLVTANNNNSGQADYDIEVSAIPSAVSYAWTGNALASGENSQIRVSFPSSGLYSFSYGANIDTNAIHTAAVGNGRYQFLVDDAYIQKTVEADGSVTYYVPAGTHNLTIDQDSTLGADWNLNISGPTAALDSLTYQKMGGEIGGIGNDFTEEWLPVYLGEETPVNAVISIMGAEADSVTVEVWNATTKVKTIKPVFGTESLWATFTLPANGRLHLITAENNSATSYKIALIDIPEPAFSWAGTSLKNGLNSTIEMYMPVGGVYNIQGVYAEGFASLIINPNAVAMQNAPTSINADLNMNVNLNAGTNTFVVRQGSSFATSTWEYSITLVSAFTPTISTVTPDTVNSGVAHTITVTGANFDNGVVLKLLGDSSYTLATTRISDTELTAVVPAGVKVDLYDVQVVNPDTKSDTLEDGLEVVYNTVFLPMIIKN